MTDATSKELPFNPIGLSPKHDTREEGARRIAVRKSLYSIIIIRNDLISDYLRISTHTSGLIRCAHGWMAPDTDAINADSPSRGPDA